jgi:hypothetical protein
MKKILGLLGSIFLTATATATASCEVIDMGGLKSFKTKYLGNESENGIPFVKIGIETNNVAPWGNEMNILRVLRKNGNEYHGNAANIIIPDEVNIETMMDEKYEVYFALEEISSLLSRFYKASKVGDNYMFSEYGKAYSEAFRQWFTSTNTTDKSRFTTGFVGLIWKNWKDYKNNFIIRSKPQTISVAFSNKWDFTFKDGDFKGKKMKEIFMPGSFDFSFEIVKKS